jgi:hypothetical protein
MKKLVGALILSVILVLSGCSEAKIVTTDEVIKVFKDAGLEAENPVVLTAEDLDVLPFTASKVVRSSVPSLGEAEGLRIFIFDDNKSLDAAKAYFDKMAKSSKMFSSWTATNGNVLIQLSGGVKEEDFNKYKAALKKL